MRVQSIARVSSLTSPHILLNSVQRFEVRTDAYQSLPTVADQATGLLTTHGGGLEPAPARVAAAVAAHARSSKHRVRVLVSPPWAPPKSAVQEKTDADAATPWPALVPWSSQLATGYQKLSYA